MRRAPFFIFLCTGYTELEAAIGTDTPYSGYGLTGIGRTLLDSGEHLQAIQVLRKAIALYEAGSVDPGQIAVARFALARALYESGSDRAQGLAFAREARTVFEVAGQARRWELGQIDAWFSAQGS